jgi:hypothetical protein
VIEDEKVMLMAQTPSTSGCDNVWYLETGANNHMTGHKHLFVEMTELAGTVSFGDASKVEVKGKGNVKFLQKNGKLGMVENVYYISEIKSKSVGQLMEKGFEIFMKKRTLHMKDSRGRVIARVEMGKNRKVELAKDRGEISQDQQGRRSLVMAHEVRTSGVQ